MKYVLARQSCESPARPVLRGFFVSKLLALSIFRMGLAAPQSW